MIKLFLLISLFFLNSSFVISQDNLIGKSEITIIENGFPKKQIVLNPLKNEGIRHPAVSGNVTASPQGMNTNIRWSYQDPASIGNNCLTSGNGKYNVCGWNLNNERISFGDNVSANPLWEYSTDPNVFINFISISDTGGVIALGSLYNVLLFTNSNNVPFFNFDLTQLADTGIATALDITKDGKFLVCSASRQDSSTIFGFNSTSTNSVWKKRIVPTVATGGASIQGITMSANDSLIIVNTYAEFFVLKTYSGQLLFSGLINPSSSSSGTQSPQGISGNGNFIATINYTGALRVYQWNGSTYNFVWQNQEPPGMFYNWYTSVDISYDGQYVAAGTLNFLTSSSYDGKIKVFKTSGNGTPQWTYSGCGDEVNAVSFSSSGNILSAASWGEFSNSTEDLYIFKTFHGNVPIYKVNSPGSLFSCNTSNDGKTVIASGKAVHARQFGNGGLLYNIEVDTSDSPTAITSNSSGIVFAFTLEQNFPNPFNPVTTIKYNLNASSYVIVKVYNALGSEVKLLMDDFQNAGQHEIKFDGSEYPSGVYYYKITAGNFTDVKSMVLLK